MNCCISVAISSFIKFPLKNHGPVSYPIEYWSDDQWRGIVQQRCRDTAIFRLEKPLSIPSINVPPQSPDFNFGETLCLRINDQNVYSYLWIDTHLVLPKLWIMQPFFGKDEVAEVPELSISGVGGFAQHHGTFFWAQKLNRVSPGEKEISKLNILNNSNEMEPYRSCFRIHYEKFNGLPGCKMCPFQKSESLLDISIPEKNLSPKDIEKAQPFWMGLSLNFDNTTESHVLERKGILFDQTGYPYLIQSVPVHGDVGESLRATIISDGNILMIGTMDLDPS